MLTLHDNIAAFDTETTGLYPWPLLSRKALGLYPDRPFMFQVANVEGEAVSFRGEVNPKTREVTYRNCKREVRWLREEVIGNPKMRVICHNLPFEYRMTTQEDLAFKWRCRIDDTRIMARVANPIEPDYRLKRLAREYLEIPDDDQKALTKELHRARMVAKRKGWAIAVKESHGKDPSKADYWLPELASLVQDYGERDPIRTMGLWLVYQALFEENRQNEGRLHEIYEWERKLMRVTFKMERTGMTYLADAGQELREFYTDYMAKHKRKIAKLGYPKLNLQSGPQMQEVFIRQLGRQTAKMTNPSKKHPNGQPKIDAEQLMAWARGSQQGADVDGDGPDGCKLSRNILEWKAGKKVIEYLDSYDFFSCENTDGSIVLHPAWDQGGARTGRFSCKDPNTMQIASAETSRRHSHVRARQREVYGPRPGYLWYMPDYSQIEVWVFAFASNERAMMDALLNGEDFHYATAKAAWGMRDNFCTCGMGLSIPREMHQKGCLVKWWRQRAKMLLFSRLYGGGLKKVAELIRCSLREAEEFVEQFNENLPGVKRYMDRVVEEVAETGRLVNLFGREYIIEKRKAYKAVNYMVQGSSAEVMKRAIVRVARYLDQEYRGSYVIGTVHDELIAEIKKKHHSDELMRTVVKLMQADSDAIPNLTVPLPVGMKYTTTNWSHAKEVDVAKRAA